MAAMAQAGWLPCRFPHCSRAFPSVEALLQHSTTEHMTGMPDVYALPQANFVMPHLSLDGIFASLMSPCLTGSAPAQRFKESEFEARVRTFLAYLPADAANGVNFALDQFRFVHGTTGDQESLAGVALGTPVCIAGVAWVLLRGMEGPSVGVNVQLGPLTAWSVTYDLPQLRAMPVVYVDTARFKGVQLRQPNPSETAFPDDYRSAVISANVFALILQYPSISTKSLLEMLERVNISGREVLDRGRFILHQCQALQCQDITDSNFIRDLVSAVVEVGVQSLQAVQASPPSGHAVQPAVRPPPPASAVVRPRKPPAPAPKAVVEPGVPKRRGRPPVHGRYMSDPSRLAALRQPPMPPSTAPTTASSDAPVHQAKEAPERRAKVKADAEPEPKAQRASSKKQARMKTEEVAGDESSEEEDALKSEETADKGTMGGEESMDDEDAHVDVEPAAPAKVEELADAFPAAFAFRSLLTPELLCDIVAVAEFASSFDELLGFDGAAYRSLDKTIEAMLAPNAAEFTMLVDHTARFILVGDAPGTRAFRAISESTISEAHDTSAGADDARLTQASAVSMEVHAYGVTELARLALLSDDFLDLDELMATPADEQDARKQRMASLARMLSSGRELAALPTAERVLLLRSLFDRCLNRNEAWQFIERASWNLNSIRQARRRDWNTMTVVGRSIATLDNDWRMLAAAKVSAAGDLESKEKVDVPADADEKIASMRAEIARLVTERDAVKTKLVEHQKNTFEYRRRLRPGPLGFDRAQRSYWLLATAPGVAVLDADQVTWGVYRTKAAFHLLLRVLCASRDLAEKLLLSTLRKERDFIARLLERCEDEDARKLAEARSADPIASDVAATNGADKDHVAAEIVNNVYWVGPRALPAVIDADKVSDFAAVRAAVERAASAMARCGVITEAARRRFVAEVPDNGDDAEAAAVAESLGALLDSPRPASKLGTARLDHLRLCAALLRGVSNVAQLMLQLAVLERIAAEHAAAPDDSDDSDSGADAAAPVAKAPPAAAAVRRVATRSTAAPAKAPAPAAKELPMTRKKTAYSLRTLKVVAVADDSGSEEEVEDELLQSTRDLDPEHDDEALHVDVDSEGDQAAAKEQAPESAECAVCKAKTRPSTDRLDCQQCARWAHRACIAKKVGPKTFAWTCSNCNKAQ